MAQQLWLLRHGEAEPHGQRPDEQRQLTERGERQSRDAGRALAALGVDFDAVFASPRVRGIDTARLACEALGLEAIEHQPLSSGFGAPDARELLGGYGDRARVLVSGHEPDFSMTVHDLTGARIDLKKGGLAVVRLDGTLSELILLLRPRELAAIAG